MMVSSVSCPSMVAAPISTRLVAAISNRQNVSSPQMSLASFCRFVSLKVGENMGTKLGE